MSDLKPVSLHQKKPASLWMWLSHRKLYLVPFFVIAILLFIISNQPSGSAVFRYVLGQEEKMEFIDGRLNVLLLGTAGGNHEGPNLTDTIMVASLDKDSGNVKLFSLPRDIWLQEQQTKINTIYQKGLEKGDGLRFAREEIGKILGITIPYAVRVDFAGFVKAVDLIEGIDVFVEYPFDDYAYPIPGKEDDLCGYKEEEREIDEEQAKTLGVEKGKLKVLINPQGNIATAEARPKEGLVYNDKTVLQFFYCRFEHLSYKRGQMHLNGEAALKYVRSRHGTNGEGSDFARSRRQQQVIQAFKEKVLSLDTLTDPQKMIGLATTFGKSIDTNFTQDHYLDLIKIAKDVDGVRSVVIGSEVPPLLINPPLSNYGGAWVLIPPKDDFTPIHLYVQKILTATESAKPKR